jgi:hypothetical protein
MSKKRTVGAPSITREMIERGLISDDFIGGMQFYKSVLYDTLEIIKASRTIELETWEQWLATNLPALENKIKAQLEKGEAQKSGGVFELAFKAFVDFLLAKWEKEGKLEGLSETLLQAVKGGEEKP